MSPQEELAGYRYRGARAMVLLHEQSMREFVATWRKAKETGVALPSTADPNYRSLEALLRHILHWARTYMVWMCESLELEDPQIPAVPEEDAVESEAEVYLGQLLRRWREPLKDVPEDRYYRLEHTSPWNIKYCIDSMLEHAVMHPIRHRFQLTELMERK